MSQQDRETVLLVRQCNACGHEWIRHNGCTSWHGFHTCEACASEDVKTVKECTESQWRAVAQHLASTADVQSERPRESASVRPPQRLVCRACQGFLPGPSRPASAAAASVHPDFCDACQAGRNVPTTCFETAYGTVERLSFQIKVF